MHYRAYITYHHLAPVPVVETSAKLLVTVENNQFTLTCNVGSEIYGQGVSLEMVIEWSLTTLCLSGITTKTKSECNVTLLISENYETENNTVAICSLKRSILTTEENGTAIPYHCKLNDNYVMTTVFMKGNGIYNNYTYVYSYFCSNGQYNYKLLQSWSPFR